MNVLEGVIAYQVVIFTYRHTIVGELSLKDKRLSDHINERVESMLVLRNVTVARLEDPANIMYTMPSAVIPKAGVVLVFEPPQQAIPPSNRFFGYMKKEKYEVFLILDGMEVRGTLHTPGNLDFRRVLVNSPDAFLPITQATVAMEANRKLVVRQDAILVNSQRIRFFGSLQPLSPTQPRITEELPQSQ
jgi:hypothetical protein